MPYYDFLNEKTSEIKTFFFHMNEEKVYIDDENYKWTRLFSSPNPAVDTKIDPHSAKQFREKFKNKSHTVGDLWSESGRLSEKRGGMTGKDEMREKVEKKYEERCKVPHPHKKKPNIIEI